MTKFCANCGIALKEGVLGFGGTKTYEFEDGWYCEECAKVKVKRARNN